MNSGNICDIDAFDQTPLFALPSRTEIWDSPFSVSEYSLNDEEHLAALDLPPMINDDEMSNINHHFISSPELRPILPAADNRSSSTKALTPTGIFSDENFDFIPLLEQSEPPKHSSFRYIEPKPSSLMDFPQQSRRTALKNSRARDLRKFEADLLTELKGLIAANEEFNTKYRPKKMRQGTETRSELLKKGIAFVRYLNHKIEKLEMKNN